MPETYIVLQGDSIASIAFRYRLFPEAIWDHPDNAELRSERDDPNALYPGDRVVIPDRVGKEEVCASAERHRFRRKGVPERLRIRFLDEEAAPRSEIPFVLDMETRTGWPVPPIDGTTDPDGFLDVSIPPDAAEGTVTLREGDEEDTMVVKPGHIDPIDTLSGIKGRLTNLGYPCGGDGEKLDDRTRAAIRSYQERHGLPLLASDATDVDRETRDAIQTDYSG